MQPREERMSKTFGYLTAAGLIFASAVAQGAAADDDIAKFYHGKQLTMIVGSDVGGGYDIYARTVARHLGKYIPGQPTFIVQNMPGAGSLKMTNHVANVLAKDGTIIGAPQNGVAFEPVLHLLSPGGKSAQYDGTKFNWIGSAEQGVYVSVFWHTAGIKSLDDLRKGEVMVGASSLNTDEAVIANILNNMFDTKLKLITGYKSNPAIMLAMEKGEVSGVAATSFASLSAKQPTWFKEGKVTIPIQMALDPEPALKDVPLALDIVKSPDDRRVLEVVFTKYKMSRPYFFAEGVPADRVAAVRAAFLEACKDPKFLAESKKQGIQPQAVPGEVVQKMVERIYETPEPLLKQVRAIIGGK
jgi:tripartite-type tricarboxylate transporter receptor subunit TctC